MSKQRACVFIFYFGILCGCFLNEDDDEDGYDDNNNTFF